MNQWLRVVYASAMLLLAIPTAVAAPAHPPFMTVGKLLALCGGGDVEFVACTSYVKGVADTPKWMPTERGRLQVRIPASVNELDVLDVAIAGLRDADRSLAAGPVVWGILLAAYPYRYPEDHR